MLAHEHGPAHGRLAAHVVQVAPQQDGALALLPEGAVHGQHVQVGGAAPGPVQRQRLLGRDTDTSQGRLCAPQNHPRWAESSCPESPQSAPFYPS